MCANIHSQNGTAILAQELLSRKWENLKVFLSTPSIRATAMSGAPVSFDRIIPEETQGPMPVEAPTTLASGSLDSFHHVEAVLKEENVSTGTLDSQDWEMVTEMVEDTDNAATHFLQGKHVVDLEGPAPNLQDSIDKMIETVEKMKPIKEMSIPFSTMLPGRCRRQWFSWSSSTNFTKLGICWLLPIHVEMTINGLMNWRILILKALILLWE